MSLLIQFLLRLSFGLAVGMAITSSKKVTSGYFRNHLYVTLGLSTLAALVSYTAAPEVFWYAVGAAAASYVGSVCWLYEESRLGKTALLIVALCAWEGSECELAAHPEGDRESTASKYELWTFEADVEKRLSENKVHEKMQKYLLGETAAGTLSSLSILSSGLLLGMTMAAMLLGHWYLNTPTMELAPLRRLILAMGAAVVLQMIVSALGLWGELTYANEISTQWWLFLLLRWSFGLIGVATLAWMAWQTLNVPNTQSATGILYVAVIGTFVGETMALLLSAESMFPL